MRVEFTCRQFIEYQSEIIWPWPTCGQEQIDKVIVGEVLGQLHTAYAGLATFLLFFLLQQQISLCYYKPNPNYPFKGYIWPDKIIWEGWNANFIFFLLVEV